MQHTRKLPLNSPWQRKWIDLEVRTAEIQVMADEVSGWAKRFFNNVRERRIMTIIGLVGVGKTHTAEKMFQWAKAISITAWDGGNWPHPPRIEWVEWGKVAFLDHKEFQRWMDGTFDIDLLFIEDIGAEVDRYKSGEPTERLREVLNEFKNKWIFITTNVFPEDWKIKWDERVADRLMRNSTMAVLRESKSFAGE